MRRIVTTICLTGWVVCWCGLAAAESARATEREHDRYRQLRKTGLAELALDASATRYELAVAVGTAIERLKARAWSETASDAQKYEALQAMQWLVTECRADLQRLNISLKATLTLISTAMQGLGMEVSATPRAVKISGESPRAKPITTKSELTPRPRGLELSNAVMVNALIGAPSSASFRPLAVDFTANDRSEASLLRARALLSPALDLSSSYSHLRTTGDRASRTDLSYSPGPLTLTGSFGTAGRNLLTNAMTGNGPQVLPFGYSSFGGEAVVRGPYGLRFGGGLEGIQGTDTDLFGRYSTMVGFQAGQRLQLSLDLKRSAYMFDRNASGLYSAQFGVGFSPSHSLAFQLRYQMSEYDWRAFGQRDNGLQGFVAGQVSIRW